jgi:tetratricopeptide (TPR) repeat protein
MKTINSNATVKFLLAGILLLFVTACGGRKAIRPESELDTPETAYDRGRTAIDNGQPDQAIEHFERALSLAKNAGRDFPAGHEGLGRAHLAKDDVEEAESSFRQARFMDRDYAPAYTGLGRVSTAKGDYSDARRMFDRAEDRADTDLERLEAHLYQGLNYGQWGRYGDARGSLKEALEIDPMNQAAVDAMERIQAMEIAQAGMPPEYRRIAVKETVNRADLAALLAIDLPLDRIFRGPADTQAPGFRPPDRQMDGQSNVRLGPALKEITDIDDNWAEAYIRQIVELGIMDQAPDGSFAPQDPVTRAEMAVAVQTLLVKALRDQSLATRFVGNASAFNDVPGSHFAFNAITLVTSRRIMSGSPDGSFGLLKPVSGSEALLAIRALKSQLQ